MKTNPYSQAFPLPWSSNATIENGLTKRELAAIKIMAGMAANFDLISEDLLKEPARISVAAADALIAELSKESEKQL